MKLLTFTLIFIANATFAGTHDHSKDHKSFDQEPSVEAGKMVSKDKILVKVNGMVCSFCAQGIEKNFKKLEQVETVKVDLDKMEVHLSLVVGGKLPKADIKKTVEGAGFKFIGMNHE